MSRCIACDKRLNDSELRATITLPTGQRVPRDTCNYCNNFVRNPNFTPPEVSTEFGIDAHLQETGSYE